MPSLEPGRPGAKEVYEISLLAPGGTVPIPPKAFGHFALHAGDLAVAVTTHRGEGGFALLNKPRAEVTVFRKYVARLRQPDDVRWFQRKAYALVRLGNGRLRLASALRKAFHLKVGDRLMAVKSTTVALSLTPVEIWKAKFRRRGMHEAIANLDKLAVFGRIRKTAMRRKTKSGSP